MPYIQPLQTLIFLAAFNFLMTYSDLGLPANHIKKDNHTSLDIATNKTSKLEVIPNHASDNVQEVSEGGPVTSLHTGREHVIEAPIHNVTNKSGLTNNLTKLENTIPVQKTVISDMDTPLQHEKPSVPKKGVSFTKMDHQNDSVTTLDLNKTNVNVSNSPKNSSNQTHPQVTSLHKKPLVTESDDDYIQSQINSSKENIILDAQPDPVLVQKNKKRSDYIVPIVAVILSVPLVAILISVVYKRGTDWWQHRNYKRMDFLIEGMYHN